MKKIPIILDGDPGHDDAIAWMLACSSEKLDVKGAVAVSGNVSLDKTAYNAQRILTLLGRADIPIAKGAAKPLLGKPMDAPSVHGVSGLDGPSLPEPKIALSSLSGVELMAKIISESDEPVTIVSTGPLTDTAILLFCYPKLKNKIKQISLMGGGVLTGNWTPAAEFNILVDPEAARSVFESGVPIIMSGLDVTEKALILPEDFQRVRNLDNQVAIIMSEWLEFFYKFHLTIGYRGAPMHDPCAVAVLLYPELFDIKEMYVHVDCSGKYTRGATVGDYYNRFSKAPNTKVLLDVNREKFVQLLIDAVATYGGKNE